MNAQPLISIVTPSYNQAKYLEATIRSVLGQDYHPLEYFVVDGGSSDGSQEIIQRYASQIAWWVSEKDRGQGDAINKGFARARGEIIGWLNSDDLYLPGALQSIVEEFRNNPDIGVVYGDAITIDANGNLLNPLKFDNYQLLDLMRFRIICQPAVFFRKDVLERAGMLDLDYHYMLDHQLWLRMAAITRFKHLPNFLAAARHHESAKNVKAASAFADEIDRIVHWMNSTPMFDEMYRRNQRFIIGGAERLKARYLLDGGMAKEAMYSYLKSLRYTPFYALKHWHRMVYAILYMTGARNLNQIYYRMRGGKTHLLAEHPEWQQWLTTHE